jgi:segregation and condensation protein B
MYSLTVKSIFNSYLSRMHCQDKTLYSQTLLETIAAIAMHQPITKKQVEDKIGKEMSEQVLFQLQDLQWIKSTMVKSDHQEYFSTTKEFLRYFNITSVIELEKKLNAILLNSNLQVVW